MINKLKEIRIKLHLTQNQVADVLGISRSAYSVWESEIEIIPIKHLSTLCNYFNISFDYLFGFNEIENYPNTKLEIDKDMVGKRLHDFRKENKLTQEKLASKLNVSRTTITEYERGKNLIATPFLYDICKKYNVSADYLLGRIDSPKYFKKKLVSKNDASLANLNHFCLFACNLVFYYLL